MDSSSSPFTCLFCIFWNAQNKHNECIPNQKICFVCITQIKKKIQSVEDLSQYTCNHIKSISSKLAPDKLSRRQGYYCESADCFVWCCTVCMRLLCDEFKHRRKKTQTLVTKCACVIARNSDLLLAATQLNFDEHMWESIYHEIPVGGDGQFKKSDKNKFMCRSIARFFDCC